MPRQHKYNARPTRIVDARFPQGHTFPSKKEAEVYRKLSLLEKAGKVSGLRCQVRYPLTVNNCLVSTYAADFVYFDVELAREVVADAKGYRTREYRIKKKLMKAIHGIDITEL
jgi:hypothetical protein